MPTSPIQAVHAAIESGGRSRAAIAAETGLEPGTVDLISEHLTASGVLDMEPLGLVPSGRMRVLLGGVSLRGPQQHPRSGVA